MKTLITTILVAISFVSFAQIKVFTGGRNSYGTTNEPPSGTKHYMSGDVTFDQWVDINLNANYTWYQPNLYTQRDKCFVLGRPWFNRINEIHAYTLYISSAVRWVSDSRLKQNINYDLGTLYKLRQLRPVSYNFTDSLFGPDVPQSQKDSITATKQYGIIAQELYQILPELISIDSTTGYYSVNYINLIPILIDGVNFQSKQIDSIKTNFEQFEETTNQTLQIITNYINGIWYSIDSIKNNCCVVHGIQHFNKPGSTGSSLGQYAYDKLKHQISIDYMVDDKNTTAQIMITDLTGKFVNLYNLTDLTSTLVLNTNELYKGILNYTLLIDDMEIETKKMIITE